MLDDFKAAYFIGIGGAGMSALAWIYSNLGKTVYGSDVGESFIVKQLKESGIQVDIPQSTEVLEKFVQSQMRRGIRLSEIVVIYTNAIPEDNPQFVYSKAQGLRMYNYPQAVGMLTHQFPTIGVAGTHGKSTTTAILAQASTMVGMDPLVLVGALFGFLGDRNFRVPDTPHPRTPFILEADEYKDAFLNYVFDTLVIVSLDYDHPDYFKTPQQYLQSFFKAALKAKRGVVLNLFEPEGRRLKQMLEQSGYKGEIIDFSQYFDTVSKFSLYLKTRFLIEDAAAAYATLVDVYKKPTEDVRRAIESYQGLWRRFEFRGQLVLRGNNVFVIGSNKNKESHKSGPTLISDYAHNPKKLQYLVRAIQDHIAATNPGAQYLLIWEPHHHDRAWHLKDEFVKVLLEALGSRYLWQIWITDIYRARNSVHANDISAKMLVDSVRSRAEVDSRKKIKHVPLDRVKKELAKSFQDVPQYVVIASAGKLDGLFYPQGE